MYLSDIFIFYCTGCQKSVLCAKEIIVEKVSDSISRWYQWYLSYHNGGDFEKSQHKAFRVYFRFNKPTAFSAHLPTHANMCIALLEAGTNNSNNITAVVNWCFIAIQLEMIICTQKLRPKKPTPDAVPVP